MQIPLINEHLFCKYFVRLSVGNARKGFATYGCCHPCFLLKIILSIFTDQVSDLSQKITTQLDSRLISLERKLENLNVEMKGIQVL